MDAVKLTVGCLALLLAGCLGAPTPREREADELGFDGVERGPEHNAGKPCTVCHGTEFAVAGTIYLYQDEIRGLGGATVEITDDLGRSFEVRSNDTGNFMVRGVPGNENDPNPRVLEPSENGQVQLSYWPVFPLRVRVSQGDLAREMNTVIHREPSCSRCHFEEPDVDSVGRVFLMER